MRDFGNVVRTTGAIIASVLVFWTGGCASVRQPEVRQPGPMTELQVNTLIERLGRIAVVGARYAPRAEIQTPAKGAAAPVEILKGDSSGYGAVLAIALMPVGAAEGNVTAERAERANERERGIKQALESLRVQETLRDRFAARLTALQTYPALPMPNAGPTVQGQKPDYRHLQSWDIDTVNEIAVQDLALTGDGKSGPDLAVRLTAQVRLISTTDVREFFVKTYSCSSATDTFEAWAAQNARKFQEAIERCYDDIAWRVVTDLYMSDTLVR